MARKSTVSLRGLRTFCVAAKHSSFSTAADALFITPSAVSHQVKNLETELGQRLFDRNARDLRLTGVGQSLFEDVSPLIEQIDTTVGNYRETRGQSAVRMSVQPFFASEFFVPRLSEFTADHPEISIQVAASDESPENHPSDADLSIRLFRAPPPGISSQLLFPMRLAPAGSRQLASSLKVEDGRIVSDFPLIVHESYPKAWKQWSRAAGIKVPKDARVTRLDSMIAIVRAVEQGMGAALVPVPVADQWFLQGTITRLFDADLIADVSYYLAWQERRPDRPDLALLRNWIIEKFAEAA